MILEFDRVRDWIPRYLLPFSSRPLQELQERGQYGGYVTFRQFSSNLISTLADCHTLCKKLFTTDSEHTDTIVVVFWTNEVNFFQIAVGLYPT